MKFVIFAKIIISEQFFVSNNFVSEGTLFAMLWEGAAQAGEGRGPRAGGVRGRALQAALGARPTAGGAQP